ncbi:NAD(P)H-binding protein [Flammeovirga sp. MY04]|uniref:NAD(P)H-binding protein n=1 Tax=Flammeovirga sp. MY04 TaxID=1191459 RepID=UPI0008061E9D|nr:NAD(P)H-binding protein [Flammeovirga sp. MY04]ANQ49778.1 NAD(P)H-binding protein [Flammeovirga sp. MY04]
MKFSEIKKVSVIGAGWLGFPLVEKLLEKGYQVKASTTTESKILKLREMGVKAYNLNFSPTIADIDQLNDLLDTDAVVICIPPRFRQHQLQTYHAEQIKVIKDAIEDLPVNKVIYTSSTGIYENSNKEINENSPTSTSPKAKSILLAEEVLRINTDLDATILRLGGLMGYDRIPAKYVDGKKDLNYGDIPVNYVFRDDVIRAILHILDLNDHNAWNKVFNLVAPEHPPKRLVYESTAKFGEYILPTYINPETPPAFKIINSDKITSKIGFEFLFPNPLEFEYESFSV